MHEGSNNAILTYNLNTVQVDSDINVHFTGRSTKFALKLNPAKCIYMHSKEMYDMHAQQCWAKHSHHTTLSVV